MKAGRIRLKRVYDQPAEADGARVLVERLWPRGISKERASLDAWLKDLAPSSELRKWFRHDPAKWAEFRQFYRAELRANPEGVKQLRALLRQGRVTFVYAASDPAHNSALVLKEYLEES
jgi:uncharacterized protein YeaO (DUF488 family)